mgnify:CR=1 FL=1
MAHRVASSQYLPLLGEEKGLEDMVPEMSSSEMRLVARHEGTYGSMVKESEAMNAFRQYREDGGVNSPFVDESDLEIAVRRAAIDGVGDLDRFLYSEVGELGEYTFHAEGQHKRVYHDRGREEAIIEGRDCMYSVPDNEELMDTIISNHRTLESADTVTAPVNEEPELMEYEERPVLRYGFNQEMVPSSELSPEQINKVESLLKKAEHEMKQLVENGEFQTTQPQDFHFTEDERAKTHAYVPSTDPEVLENLDQIIVGYLGEIPRTYKSNGSGSRFAIR